VRSPSGVDVQRTVGAASTLGHGVLAAETWHARYLARLGDDAEFDDPLFDPVVMHDPEGNEFCVS